MVSLYGEKICVARTIALQFSGANELSVFHTMFTRLLQSQFSTRTRVQGQEQRSPILAEREDAHAAHRARGPVPGVVAASGHEVAVAGQHIAARE
jgi:hypothetical protein